MGGWPCSNSFAWTISFDLPRNLVPYYPQLAEEETEAWKG